MATTSIQEMIIKLQDKTEIERLISLINLGICAALESQILSIEEAEFYLYSPHTMEQLKKLGVAQELIDVVHLGTELEDVKSLLPEKLSDSIAEIKAESIKFLKSLRSVPSKNFSRKKWIQT
jgi:hypothetical protein